MAEITQSQNSWTDMFHQYSAEIMERIKSGKTEVSIPIGGSEMTQTEWEKALKSVDKQIQDIKEEQEERFARLGKKEAHQAEATAAYEAAVSGKVNPVEQLRSKPKAPYDYLAKDGIIEYKGAVFVCDEKNNCLCLGDVSDKENVLTIPLSGGGCLKVNRDNLGELADAIDMFSPEDINLIMRAIAQDNKARSMKKEMEDAVSEVGEKLADGSDSDSGEES